jgi:hypothetical protein
MNDTDVPEVNKPVITYSPYRNAPEKPAFLKFPEELQQRQNTHHMTKQNCKMSQNEFIYPIGNEP